MKKFYHKNNKKIWFVFLLSLIIALVSFIFLPDQLPIHFNAQGIADNFAGRWSIFLAPVIILAFIFLADILRDLDPKSKNYFKFEEYYYKIHFAVSLLMVFIQIYTIAYVSGLKIGINQFIYPMIAILLMFLGNLLPKFKYNYFVGIRTPWTIDSEKVWYFTHRFAGKLFVVLGFVLALSSFFLFQYIQIVLITIIILLVLLPFATSYYYHRKYEEDVK